jgi:hypothetical protein
MKLCFEGFVVRNQKLTPIWTPVFDVLIDLQVSKIEPPEPPRGSKNVANTKVQTWKSGGGGEIRTLDALRHATFPRWWNKPLSDASV